LTPATGDESPDERTASLFEASEPPPHKRKSIEIAEIRRGPPTLDEFVERSEPSFRPQKFSQRYSSWNWRAKQMPRKEFREEL